MAKKNDAEEKKVKKKKKKGKLVLFLLLIIVVLLAVLYFGRGGFGFGSGSGTGKNDAVDAMATVDEQTDAPEETPEETTITVEITENTVKFGAEEFSDYDSFEKYFYENKPEGKDYILKDNQAIKSVYDSVKALMDSFDCTYSEEVV